MYTAVATAVYITLQPSGHIIYNLKRKDFYMKFTKEERLEIGRKVYSYEISISDAAKQYNLNWYTVRTYMREYRELNHLPNMSDGKPIKKDNKVSDLNDLEQMTKDQLISEVIKARVDAERAKKGYIVKGDGQEKVFNNLKSLNSK